MPVNTEDVGAWRQISRYLWVGEHAGNHVGIIEHGHGFVAIDGRGEVRGRYKSLDEARGILDSLADSVLEDPAPFPLRAPQSERA